MQFLKTLIFFYTVRFLSIHQIEKLIYFSFLDKIQKLNKFGYFFSFFNYFRNISISKRNKYVQINSNYQLYCIVSCVCVEYLGSKYWKSSIWTLTLCMYTLMVVYNMMVVRRTVLWFINRFTSWPMWSQGWFTTGLLKYNLKIYFNHITFSPLKAWREKKGKQKLYFRTGNLVMEKVRVGHFCNRLKRF